jgi:nitrogen fixation protein NifU and related proteins
MPPLSAYTKKVMKKFLQPKNYGEIKDADAVGKVGNPVCGDIMWMYIKVDKKTQVIKKVKFKTFGCAAAIASTEMLAKIAKGKTIEEAEKLTMKNVKDALEDLPQIKIHCSMMAIQSLKKAIKDYKTKHKDK